MIVLIIGSGGREHAIAWKLAQSGGVEKIYAAPGNGGTAVEAKTENVPLTDFVSDEGQKAVLEFAKKQNVTLVVIGPEAPLAAGLADKLRGAGFAVVGAGAKAAQLETSKNYAKAFMAKYGIRHAQSKTFTDYSQALGCIKSQSTGNFTPQVIKADGLAGGKGVVIAQSIAEAENALKAFMQQGVLGDAGKCVVIEEYLAGVEVSVLAAVSVTSVSASTESKNATAKTSPQKISCTIKPFLPARDHKRRFDGAQGENTGGMGAVAPVPDFTPALQKDFVKNILAPTIKGIEAEKLDYNGFIFFGLMIKDGLCYLLEYNARLGDPETQAVLPLMESGFAELCRAITEGTLADFSISWKNAACCAPVVVSQGYPGAVRAGAKIALNVTGIEKSEAKLFVAAAQRGEGGSLGSGLVTTGGRVLAVSALGADADAAYKNAYNALRFINFDGMAYRKDIGCENV